MPRAWTTRTSGGQVSFSSSSSSIFQSPIRFLLCFEFLTPNSVNFASSRSVHISPSYFLFTPSSPSSTHWIISLLRSPAPIFNSFLNDQFTPPLSYLVNFSILIPTFLSILFPPSNPIYPLIRISAPSIVPFLSPNLLSNFIYSFYSLARMFFFLLSCSCSTTTLLARCIAFSKHDCRSVCSTTCNSTCRDLLFGTRPHTRAPINCTRSR